MRLYGSRKLYIIYDVYLERLDRVRYGVLEIVAKTAQLDVYSIINASVIGQMGLRFSASKYASMNIFIAK